MPSKEAVIPGLGGVTEQPVTANNVVNINAKRF
jgi:hypothetical protein